MTEKSIYHDQERLYNTIEEVLQGTAIGILGINMVRHPKDGREQFEVMLSNEVSRPLSEELPFAFRMRSVVYRTDSQQNVLTSKEHTAKVLNQFETARNLSAVTLWNSLPPETRRAIFKTVNNENQKEPLISEYLVYLFLGYLRDLIRDQFKDFVLASEGKEVKVSLFETLPSN